MCTIADLLAARTFPLMVTYPPQAMSTGDQVFLSPRQVFSRYGWGRTKGYEMLKSPSFPNAIGGKYRLDSLIQWENWLLGGGELAADPTPLSDGADTSEHDRNTSATTVAPVRPRRRTRGSVLNGAI